MKRMKFAVPANRSWHTLGREMTFTDPDDSTSFLFKSALPLQDSLKWGDEDTLPLVNDSWGILNIIANLNSCLFITTGEIPLIYFRIYGRSDFSSETYFGSIMNGKTWNMIP